MIAQKISDTLYYVGVNDRKNELFERMISLPHGVTYNSYLLVDYSTVECMEASEPIGREEYLLGLLIAHHHLRPMNHRGEYELQLVAAQRQLLTFVDRLYIGCNAIVTLQHFSGFLGTNQLHIGIHGKILPYTRRMVGFDMV